MRRPHSGRWVVLVLPFVVAASSDAHAQGQRAGRAGKRAVLAREFEIALARSAAPKEVSAAAEIFVLGDSGYVVAVRGTNGNACLVDRSWPESLEPTCYDAEGAATVMQTHLRRGALLQAGASMASIDQEIDEELERGRFRTPSRPSMTYMMSAAQVLYNDSGQRVGAWQPHLMIYYPNLTNEQLGLGATANMDAAVVVDPGKPWSNIMIIVKKAITPDGGSGS
ncbi:MAG: hypothetical protein ACT4P6_22485 [Gemmatimonadaceae bacterium]